MAALPRYRRPVTGRPLYHSFAWAYDLVVPEPAGPGAAAVVEALRGAPGMRVLDAGCGSGRYAAELMAAGFEVTGIDRSAELLAVARERVPGADFVVADLRDWAPRSPFDAALCRGVLNDCVDDGEREAAVAGLARALRPGGVLLVDVRDWDGSVEHYRAKPAHRVSAQSPRGRVTFASETEVDLERRLLLVRERIALEGDVESSNFTMRPWTREELLGLLRAAGFGQIAAADLGARADRIVLTAFRSGFRGL